MLFVEIRGKFRDYYILKMCIKCLRMYIINPCIICLGEYWEILGKIQTLKSIYALILI